MELKKRVNILQTVQDIIRRFYKPVDKYPGQVRHNEMT